MPDQPIDLSSEALALLREIADPNGYAVNYHRAERLPLRDLGLITAHAFNYGLGSLEYCAITDAGRRYLAELDESEVPNG